MAGWTSSSEFNISEMCSVSPDPLNYFLGAERNEQALNDKSSEEVTCVDNIQAHEASMDNAASCRVICAENSPKGAVCREESEVTESVNSIGEAATEAFAVPLEDSQTINSETINSETINSETRNSETINSETRNSEVSDSSFGDEKERLYREKVKLLCATARNFLTAMETCEDWLVVNDYLCDVAHDGVCRFPWSLVKILVAVKFQQTLHFFNANVSHLVDSPSSGDFFDVRTQIVDTILRLSQPPFLQRLVELLFSDSRTFKKTEKWIFAVRRVIEGLSCGAKVILPYCLNELQIPDADAYTHFPPQRTILACIPATTESEWPSSPVSPPSGCMTPIREAAEARDAAHPLPWNSGTSDDSNPDKSEADDSRSIHHTSTFSLLLQPECCEAVRSLYPVETRKFAGLDCNSAPTTEMPLVIGKKSLRTPTDTPTKRLVTVGSRKSQIPHMARSKETNRINNNSGKKRICTSKNVERTWQREVLDIKQSSDIAGQPTGLQEGGSPFYDECPYDDENLRLHGSATTFECGVRSEFLNSGIGIGNGSDNASFDEEQLDTSGNTGGFQTSSRDNLMESESDDSVSVHELVCDGNVSDLWPFEDVQMIASAGASEGGATGFRVATDLSSSKGENSDAGWKGSLSPRAGISETSEAPPVSNESEVLNVAMNQQGNGPTENRNGDGCGTTLEQELLDDWNDNKTQV